MNQAINVIECPSSQRSTSASPELAALKVKQQAMWASGDFAVIGTTLQIVGESLCETADLMAGSNVLDVACGNGNASLAAARRFCSVTGVDYVPELLARAAERAAAERLDATFVEGDAEKLAFGAGSFDCVLSTFGVMFAPDQPQTARELVRVCKVGGTIAVANWTPDGFIGGLLRTVAKHVPPPPFAPSPLRWGSIGGIGELFPRGVTVARNVPRHFMFRYRSAAHMIDVFRRFYGPTFKAFAALDASGQARLDEALNELIASHDVGNGKGLVVPAEYLETVLVRTA